jgi:hypothetical protein
MNPFPVSASFRFFVAISCIFGSGCATSDLVSQLRKDEDTPPRVIPLGEGKKVVMDYALRRTRVQVQLKFDVVKITKVRRVPGGKDEDTNTPPRYELWPNPASDAITGAIDYVNDPQLRFELLADERKKTFLGRDESFSYDEAGRLTNISLNYEGKAAAAAKDLLSAAFNITSLGMSLAKFGTDDNTYEKREVLQDKVIVKKTIYPEALPLLKGNRMASYSFKQDIDNAKALYVDQNSQGITSIESKFDDLSLNISPVRGRIASSQSLRQSIEAASQRGRLNGLPVRAEAPPAILSYVLISGGKADKMAEQEIAMPEIADVKYLPFPSNPWRSSIKTGLDLQTSGAIKKYGRVTSSAAADAANAANSVSTELNTDIPKLKKQLDDAAKTDASLRLKIMTEEATITQKEADLEKKVATAAALPVGTEQRKQAEAEVETAKAQLAVERQKLNYLKQGIDV